MSSFTGSMECWALLFGALAVASALVMMGWRLQMLPLTAVGAFAGALALGTLACLHVVVWRAQRQPWSAMFALALGTLTPEMQRFAEQRLNGGQKRQGE